ncbi:MAG: sortase [Ardenticatenales bacterium]|nr:sortase [Ardenticatenales bacterium]
MGRPNDAHRCFLSVSPGEPVTHRHQAQCCLSPDWHQCYRLQPGNIPVDTLMTAPLPLLDKPKPPPPPMPTPKVSPLTQRLMARAEQQRNEQPPAPPLSTEPPFPGFAALKTVTPEPEPPFPGFAALKTTEPEPPFPGFVALRTTAAPELEPVLPPFPGLPPLRQPTYTPAIAIPQLEKTGGWQTPLLWLTVTLPTVLLMLAVGLVAFVVLSSEQSTARAAFASIAKEEPGISLIDLVAPTPAATFVPMSEDPAFPPVAPPLPAAVPTAAAAAAATAGTQGQGASPDSASSVPIQPPPWPFEAAPTAPERIRAPRVGLDAKIMPVGSYIKEEGGQFIRYYEVARYAAGWHNNSSLPGYKGNVVLSGHHNTAGSVFKNLVQLEPGDYIFADVGGVTYPYLVVLKEILPETTVSDDQRALNGRWIAQTEDERLTLVTCWPPTGNSHRVIVVAIPAK